MYLSNDWALLLLLPGILAVALSLRRRGYGRAQAVGVIVLRTVTLVVLVLVLGDPHLNLRSSHRHHVFLIDVSDSFRPNRDLAEEFVRSQIARITPAERVTTIAFAGEAVVTWTGVGSSGPVLEFALVRPQTTDRTDLAQALEAAASAINPDESGVIYLVSDGLATEPLDAVLLDRLAARSIVCNVLSTRPGYSADLRILSAVAPDFPASGQPITIDVMLFCESASTATVTLTGPATDATTQVDLRPGVPTSVSLTAKAPDSGLGEYVVTVAGSPDPVPENDRLKVAVLTHAKPEIVVLGRPDSAMVSIARSMPGFTVRLRTPTEAQPLRMNLADLVDASLVVIDDLPADSLSPVAMDALRRFVEQAGGGLLMVGGPHSFASGVWAGTDVETVLAVWCDPRDARKEPLALMLVLDGSGSMSQGQPPKVELAKRAALNAVTALKDTDLVGVIVFRTSPQLLIALRSPAPLEPIRDAILSLSATGGTNMYPALLAGISPLAATDKPLKHVLLLSDGKSQPGDPDAVIAQLRQAKVTLSAVMTGAEADRDVLNRLATESGGRFYEVRQMSELSHVFLDDLRRVEGPLTRSGQRFALKSVSPLPFSAPASAPAPGAVLGYNRVRPKTDSTIIWQTEPEPDETEPVLVMGRAGLGRTAAFMSGPGSEWTGTPDNLPGLSATLAGLMSYVARQAEVADFRTDVQSIGARFLFTVSAERDGLPLNLKRLKLDLQPTQGVSRTLLLDQTAPGTYSARTTLHPDETVVLVLSDVDTGAVLNRRVLATPYSSEYRRFAPDVDVLSQLARATDGKVFTSPDQLSQYIVNPARVYQSLRWPLLVVLLVLIMGEAVLRAFGRI